MAVAAFRCTSDNACDGSEPLLALPPFLLPQPRFLLHSAASGDYVFRNIAVVAARGDDSAVVAAAAVVAVAVVWDERLLHLAGSTVAFSTAVAVVHHTQTNGRPLVPSDDADGAGMASSSAVDHTPKNSRKSTK